MGRFFSRMAWLLCVSIAVAGCGASDDVVVEATLPLSADVTATTGASESPTPAPSSPDVADPQKTKTPVAEFAPPFPERNELFEPPKRAQTTMRHDDDSGETVELKGFINVDEPKVVLSIDGVISPVPEGGEKYGVQVISIEPPSVVLQRGRSRWTATLE
jgi:hypothetical protein